MIMTDLSTILLSNTADPSCGTPRWMSPELLYPTNFGSDGRPSRGSDCYALGMTIYEVDHLLLSWSPLVYASPGTQRPSTVQSPALPRSRMCGIQRGASGQASEGVLTWIH